MRSGMAALYRVAVPLLAVAAAAWPVLAQDAGKAQRVTTDAGEALVETVAAGLEHPWGLAFLPEGGMLVTERPGRVRLIRAERPSAQRISAPLAGVPRVDAGNQGGLLDVAVDPKFAANRLIYLSYTEPREGGRNGTTVARGKLNAEGTGIEDLRVLFRQEPSHQNGLHFGSRLVFANDGSLYVTLGERFVLRDQAQNPDNHLGKIVRINADGTAPGDNPGGERQVLATRDLVDRPSQRAGRGPEPADRRTVDRRAWRARRRRDQHPAQGPQLRLAGDQLWGGLFGRPRSASDPERRAWSNRSTTGTPRSPLRA